MTQSNLSKMYGIPSRRDTALKQHKTLINKLKRNEVFLLPSQNRGYLVLKGKKERPFWNLQYYNILQSSKPRGKYIKSTKV